MNKFTKIIAKLVNKEETFYYTVISFGICFGMEVGLIGVIALMGIFMSVYDREMKKLRLDINEYVLWDDTIMGEKVKVLSRMGSLRFGPAFCLGREIFVYPQTKDIRLSKSVMLHEKCHAIHDDSFNFVMTKIASLTLVVIVTSLLSQLLPLWSAVMVAPIMSVWGYVVVKVINNFFGKLIETRADMYAVKHEGTNQLADSLPQEDALSYRKMMLNTPYFPISIRRNIICGYSRLVNK